MKRSITRVLGLLAAILLLTAAPPVVLAEGPENDADTQGASEELVRRAPHAVTPWINDVANNVNAAPFTYLTPFTELLSSSIGIMARGLDPRGPLTMAGRTRNTYGPPPGLAWEAVPEVYMAPAAPPGAPVSQGAGLVPFRDPAPAFSRNVLIPRDFSNAPIQTEPSIAVNPNDPDHLVMAPSTTTSPTSASTSPSTGA